MPVLTLFGAPEPEDKNVIGTANVINYFPKLNQQGKLLWEQRPGLTPIVTTVPPPPPADCIPYSYDWVLHPVENWPPVADLWTANLDGTLYAPNLIQPAGGVARGGCYLLTTQVDPSPEGKLWTVTLVYHNDANAKMSVALRSTTGNYSGREVPISLTSTTWTTQMESLASLEVWSHFLVNPYVEDGEPLPDTQNWIECIRVEAS